MNSDSSPAIYFGRTKKGYPSFNEQSLHNQTKDGSYVLANDFFVRFIFFIAYIMP